MSLDFRLEKIANYEDLCWVEIPQENGEDPKYRINPVTDALIWTTLIVGVPKITEKNVDEFHRRVRMFEHVCGPVLTKNCGTPSPLTREQIEQHIGLSTNADTCTVTQFNKKVAKWVEDEMS